MLVLGETVGEVDYKALRRKLGGPDHVGTDQVDLGRPSLKLGLKLVEVLTRVSGHLAVADRVLAGVLLVEAVCGVLHVTRIVWPEGQGELAATSPAAAAAARNPKQRRPGQARTGYL